MGDDVWEEFQEFNDKYFEGRLNHVRLSWSSKMTLCAGKTIYRKRGHHSSCTIRLSQPLLSQRPHSDTVNTLLHEMIHAYLHITEGHNYRDSHGPQFRKHMNRINSLHGSRVTIYHSFRREVDMYRVHVYRCDGPCVNRRPFYGVLRRAVPRPPGPSDPWYDRHRRECGGTFRKVAGSGVNEVTNKDGKGDNEATNKDGKGMGGKKGWMKFYGHVSRNTASTALSSTSGWDQDRGGSIRTHDSPYSGTKYTTLTSGHSLSSPNTTPTSGQSPSSHISSVTKSTTLTLGHSPSSHITTGRNNLDPVSRNLQFSFGLAGEKEEESVVARIKAKYSRNKHSILLSREEIQQTKKYEGGKGQPLEVCALVNGRINLSYIPVDNHSLNIHKYIYKYRKALASLGPEDKTSKTPANYKPINYESSTLVSSHQKELLYESMVGKMKDKYPDNRQVNLSSGKEMQPSNNYGEKGQPLKVFALVNGRINNSYTPINNQNLNIHKYIYKYRKALASLDPGYKTSRTPSQHKPQTQPNRQVSSQDEGIGESHLESTKLSEDKCIRSYNEGDNRSRLHLSPSLSHSNTPWQPHLRSPSHSSPISDNTIHTIPSSDSIIHTIPNSDNNTSTLSDTNTTSCPVCGITLAVVVYNEHLEGCFGSDLTLELGENDFTVEGVDDALAGWSGRDNGDRGNKRNRPLGDTGNRGDKRNRPLGDTGNRGDKRNRPLGDTGNRGDKRNRPLGNKNGDRDNVKKWEEWQMTECPNCGSMVLLDEMNFHVQFCDDEEESDDESSGQITPNKKCFLNTGGPETSTQNLSRKSSGPKTSTQTLSRKSSNLLAPQKRSPNPDAGNKEQQQFTGHSEKREDSPWKKLLAPESNKDRHLLPGDSEQQTKFNEVVRVTCPSCLEQVNESCIQTHLDLCLDFLTQEF
ncbi:hypothetical protein Pcinc_000775 [Petrolisthes cinctipes]|uniref:Protein with SprT-like domain at the N terminus n=1 Tax=Petrolisthes cinctipes TaxID=88211 RepID=A0AAE1L562_PETCI|nr:hypothetical protein Pcinc_000775 [Petrolisthes cinctipes]